MKNLITDSKFPFYDFLAKWESRIITLIRVGYPVSIICTRKQKATFVALLEETCFFLASSFNIIHDDMTCPTPKIPCKERMEFIFRGKSMRQTAEEILLSEAFPQEDRESYSMMERLNSNAEEFNRETLYFALFGSPHPPMAKKAYPDAPKGNVSRLRITMVNPSNLLKVYVKRRCGKPSQIWFMFADMPTLCLGNAHHLCAPALFMAMSEMMLECQECIHAWVVFCESFKESLKPLQDRIALLLKEVKTNMKLNGESSDVDKARELCSRVMNIWHSFNMMPLVFHIFESRGIKVREFGLIFGHRSSSGEAQVAHIQTTVVKG